MMAEMDGQPVIAGAGLAGIMAALSMGRPCILLSSGLLGRDTASSLAQGGIAAAMSAVDSSELHAEDTLIAGAGLCDPDVVRAITSCAPGAIEELLALGVPFDRNAQGDLDLHLEAAHRRARIVHARGDGSGAAIMHTLIAQVLNAPYVTVVECATLEHVQTQGGKVSGVVVRHDGVSHVLRTNACVIASGGIGGLYEETTSPAPVAGGGLSVAARAGARLIDLEFVQFHPTSLVTKTPGRRPLVSEAVRGSGALLIDETGARFTDELAPRDQVARAIAAHIAAGHETFLDAREVIGKSFPTRFPAIALACHNAGIDPVTMPIPVHPAVHYHMGGIETGLSGRTSIPGLWACGEAACTGLHGANRLASNSLLEAFVMGSAVGRDISGFTVQAPPERPAPALVAYGDYRNILGTHAGILRDAQGLTRGLELLTPHIGHDGSAVVGALVCHAALHRQESRGAHYRRDFTGTDANATRYAFTLADVFSDMPSLEKVFS